jgi:calcineurin-like phosphoesterase family protein
MNEILVENWNHNVGKNDVVFYLGDLSFKANSVETEEILKELNGKIHFIMGNHDDDRQIKGLRRFETVSDYIHLTVLDEKSPNGKQGIMMMHYPMLSWDKEHHGTWHLHGHCHQSLVPSYPEYYARKVLDMGCNGWNYTPASYEEIRTIMTKKEVSAIGHHKA